MQQITLTDEHLRKLCRINNYPIRNDEIVFFGFRGSLPVKKDNNFGKEKLIELIDVNYQYSRCTLGQWKPSNGDIAIFEGSTVPHLKYLKEGLLTNGLGVNQLMTGFYDDYMKGTHRPGTPTGHAAFIQTKAHPIRRTADDIDYDNDDRVEYMNPYDNIHCGWSMGGNTSYSSAGCQVIVGFPKCQYYNDDEGPWKVFKYHAYSITQTVFCYILFDGYELMRADANMNDEVIARLRFGSRGNLVIELQKKLQEQGYYSGDFDGIFGERTLRGVLSFQTQIFGSNADDGIVGPITASPLKLNLPGIK
jgi:hypothetical protein